MVNSGVTRDKNIEALNFASKYNRAITGGSDGHSIYELGKALTFSKSNSIDEFLDNIRKKKNYVVGQELSNGKIERLYLHIKNRINNFIKWT